MKNLGLVAMTKKTASFSPKKDAASNLSRLDEEHFLKTVPSQTHTSVDVNSTRLQKTNLIFNLTFPVKYYQMMRAIG
jgi:hypothetical protein